MEICYWISHLFTLPMHKTHILAHTSLSSCCEDTRLKALPYTGWRGADWHISNLNIAPARYLVVVGGKGNGRGEDAISYGQWQWGVGSCNNVLPMFVVSATSLGLLGRPTLLYQIFSYGGSWKTVCSGGVSWLFKNSNKPLLTSLWLLMGTYLGACTATSRHACNNALM